MSALSQAAAIRSPRRRMPKEAAVAVGASIVVHLAVLGYVASQKMQDIVPLDPGPWPDITMERSPIPPDEPHPKPPPSQIAFHASSQPTAPPDPIDVAPVEHAKAPETIATEDPPVFQGASNTLPVAADPPPVEPPKARVIRNPTWASRPTADQVARLYPRRAANLGLSGGATLMCEIAGNGAVRACEVVDESPKGRGFGDAALASARYFRLNPRTVDGETVEGARVRIPMVFNLAG